MRNIAVLLIVAAISVSAAPARPTTIAPDAVPHNIALFLGSLCKEGDRQVTFKARAYGMRFFFEEKSGVTVYRFEKGNYVREEFLKGFTLERAVNKYSQK